MKKILAVLIVLIIIPINIKAISAESYIVMDPSNKRVIDGKKINQPKLIASTSKIMTALIVIENKDLDEIVEVDEKVLSAYGSMIYVEVGEKITIRDLLYGLLLRSGNDAALLLALSVSDSMESFAYLMNQYGSNLGMHNTNFINSSGLENDKGIGNTSTAYDMALLMSYAIKNPLFLKISSTKKYQTKTNKKRYVWFNKNKLLGDYEYTIAGKTGYTKKAKRTLVSAANDNGKELVIVTLNDGNDFSDHQTLYKKYFGLYQLYDGCKFIKDINDQKKVYRNYNFIYANSCPVLVTKSEIKKIKYEAILFESKKIINNSVVGEINIKYQNTSLLSLPIKVIKKENSSWWQKIKGWLYD